MEDLTNGFISRINFLKVLSESENDSKVKSFEYKLPHDANLYLKNFLFIFEDKNLTPKYIINQLGKIKIEIIIGNREIPIWDFSEIPCFIETIHSNEDDKDIAIICGCMQNYLRVLVESNQIVKATVKEDITDMPNISLAGWKFPKAVRVSCIKAGMPERPKFKI